MTQVDKEVTPRKSDDAKGENTAHTHLEKEADELAKKAGKAEQHYDKENSIFTK
jgi:hypothetical protein